MGSKTKIEWTRGADGSEGATWTPIRARYVEPQNDGSGEERIGWHCEHASEGCRHCYSEAINRRLGTGLEFKPANLHRAEHEGRRNGEAKLFLDERILLAPLKWKRGRFIFVCSMTDLFADFVPDEWIDRIFAVMALSPQHTFQVLTKRSRRMREYCNSIQKNGRWLAMEDFALQIGREPRGRDNDGFDWLAHKQFLPSVWLGVSCEDQTRADERIPDLLATPAAVRFVSAEPLLGPVDLTNIRPDGRSELNALTGFDFDQGGVRERLDWIICGGESGPRARPFRLSWARSIIAQCKAASVPCFVKQLGANPIGRAIAFGTLTESDFPLELRDRKGGDPAEWPEDLRVRQMPGAQP